MFFRTVKVFFSVWSPLKTNQRKSHLPYFTTPIQFSNDNDNVNNNMFCGVSRSLIILRISKNADLSFTVPQKNLFPVSESDKI